MQDILIKTPIEKEASLVVALKDILGIDAGTDGYYEDPDNFVSVIVRIPTVAQLQAVSSQYDAEVI